MKQKTYTHKCAQMPEDEFAEKQRGWHIHKTNKPHSQYRVDLKDGICIYCSADLNLIDGSKKIKSNKEPTVWVWVLPSASLLFMFVAGFVIGWVLRV